MKIVRERQQSEWAKRYRLFLWIVLAALLVLAGILCYGARRRSEIPREGTLVHSGEIYEREA